MHARSTHSSLSHPDEEEFQMLSRTAKGTVFSIFAFSVLAMFLNHLRERNYENATISTSSNHSVKPAAKYPQSPIDAVLGESSLTGNWTIYDIPFDERRQRFHRRLVFASAPFGFQSEKVLIRRALTSSCHLAPSEI